MPRVIGENIRNTLIIKDPFSGDLLTIYYRPPTTEERIAYRSAQYLRDGNKIINRLTEARQEYGEKIILGFEEGCFKLKPPSPPGGEGALRTFSSDESSPNYDPSWKELLKKYASDIIEAVAEHALEGTVAVPAQEYSEKN